MTQGTMDFDYRKRCVLLVEETYRMPEHRVIYYGLTANEFAKLREGAPLPRYPVDMPGHHYGAGRTSNRGVDDGRGINKKHFFNKRIMTDDERIGLAAVQAGRDEARVRARYGVGGASRAEETEAEIARWERARCSDQDTGEEGNKEVTS